MNKILNLDLIYKKCHEDVTSMSHDNEKIQFENIRIIHLDKFQISSICPDAFAGFIYLQVLSLRDNNISFIDASTFRDCSLLQELWLSGNLLTFIDPLMLQHLKKLKKLWLDNNRIKSIEPNTFDSILSSRLCIKFNCLSLCNMYKSFKLNDFKSFESNSSISKLGSTLNVFGSSLTRPRPDKSKILRSFRP